MAGRTHLQHALPVTFGYKAAVWLAGVERHRQRLSELRPRALTGQFAGAAGTLASLGEDGFAVQEALMDELGLNRPAIRSEEHTSELQSLMRISYAVFCLKKKNNK